ncbi:MAG: hypothetical protein GX575_19020 [Candidatus Anammoximicrobium sp.]|nr:hypothetical protein [Candidatus Anammoximicrobium sp.]
MEIPTAGKLFLGGSLGACGGAVGLVRLGTAPLLVFRDVFAVRAGGSLPESLQYCGALALFSLLFGAASLVALTGLIQLARMATFSSLALILLIAAGAASAAGGGGLWLGASRQLASFRVAAPSEAGPKPHEVATAAEYALAPARVGFAGLLASSALLLVLSCGSLKGSPNGARPRVAVGVVGRFSAASVTGFALVLAATWFPMHKLTTALTSGGTVKPDEIALSISRTLQLSVLAAALLLMHGVLLIGFGILVRRVPGPTK